MKNLASRLFTAVLTGTLLVPLVGMVFWKTDETSEKRELAAWPSLVGEGKPNMRFLPEMGAWYEDHFALRPWLITAYADLENAVFQESSIRNVLRGDDGWLFYQETADQYLGLNPLSERQIFNIVHNLQLIQYSLNSNGANMLVSIVPNKNTVYPEKMKDRYLESENKDIDRLQHAISEGGIPCVDLKAPLKADERTLYFERDSHWNNQGALLAYNTLMDAMGLEHDTYETVTPEVRNDHTSDLDTMLNPKSAKNEPDYYYDAALDYQVHNVITDFMDSWIETSAPNGQSSLLMFRDSFGEALAPFLASQFSQAWFSRLTPYNLIQVESLKPEWVIIERAERRMSGFQEQAAIMKMPVVANMESTPALQSTSISITDDAGWKKIAGKVDSLSDSAQIYLQGNRPDGKVFTWPLFYIEDGYEVYLPEAALPQGTKLTVLVKDGEQVLAVDETTVEAGTQSPAVDSAGSEADQ